MTSASKEHYFYMASLVMCVLLPMVAVGLQPSHCPTLPPMHSPAQEE